MAVAFFGFSSFKFAEERPLRCNPIEYFCCFELNNRVRYAS
jgi:hypothetical protein